MSSKSLKCLAKEAQASDYTFSMVLDPVKPGKEMSTKDIGRFLEENKSGFCSSELLKCVLLNIPITVAVKEWLATIENPDTKRKYKKAMERIFALEPLSDVTKRNCAITTLDKNWSGAVGIYKLMEEIEAPESAIKTCQSVFSRFCDFIRIATLGIVDPEETPKQKEDYYAVSILYENTDWEEFISSMRTPFNLLAEMTFLAAKSCELRLRLANSKKNILSLDTSQINFQNNTISFKSEQSYQVTDILGHPLCIPFTESFMKKLKDYIGERKGVVFLSKKNKPLFATQVQREFKKASKNLPNEITPVMLGWAGVLAYKEKSKKKFPFK
ncbi:hypothetical protein wcw_p0017 (plasmid) [Waddlia chondrophila WSU 86-1044]|uniref:Tyr recombinase domain-containing protein n=2 Tax=Waddlia chondrophila TaxID=71667 RepID=D6YX22_WADCW|nr:hypothetical protein wcw_p0017 [Waddlia chondrophila WSU 86-1044]